MRNYVIINGVNSLTIPGLAIKSLPPITKPIQRTLREEIDGRDGDIITELGYGAYDKEIEIGLFGDFDVDQIIAYFNQKGTITFSNEPDKVYYFQALNQVDYEELIRFREAGVTLHCQPFKYPVTEEPLIEEYEYVDGSGESITLDNTAEETFTKFDLLGNTSQTGTPTPSSPIPVNVVSGDNEVVVSETNMLDISQLQTQTISGITITNNGNGSITINGTSTSAITLDVPITHIPLSANKTYTFGKKHAIGSGAYAISLRQQDKVFITNSSIDSSQVSVNITPTTNIRAYYMRIYIVNNRTLYNHTFFPLLKEGSTISESDYVKFNGLDTYNIDLPVENLFDKDNANLVNLFITNTSGINSSGTAKSLYISCKPNTTYTISKILSTRFVIGTTNVIPASGGSVSGRQDLSTSTSGTITTDSNANYLMVYYYSSSSDTLTEQQIRDSVQIEVGTKANSYTPYGTTPIEMCSSQDGTKRDYFLHDKTIDKWYWHREIGKAVFNGSETWSKSGNTSVDRFLLYYPYFKVNANGYSNYYPVSFTVDTTVNKLILNNGEQIVVNFSTYGTTTVAQFKTWLASNNVTVYYILATPTNTEITYQPLIEQLNTIEQATSKRGQTNITQTNNGLPFFMIVSAMKLGSDVITIPDDGNIYSKPTIKIEGTGIVDIYLNDVQEFEVDLTEDNEITIDTEKMEAYTETGLANRKVTGDYSKFKLQPGDNEIRFSGDLSKATITRYTRWL